MSDIPRRGSVGDSCFMMWLKEQREVHNRRISLTLRGEEIPRPIAYDLDKGWVEGYAQDEEGKPYTNGTTPVRTRYEGPIEVGFVPLK